jgi:hypothetical protein
MKIDIRHDSKCLPTLEYPIVLIDSCGDIVIATSPYEGVQIDGDGDVTVHYVPDNGSFDNQEWSDYGYHPATSPVTITLSNE